MTLDFISVDGWRMIMQVGNLLILMLLFKKFLFKPVQAVLQKREDEITTLYQQAGEAKASAEAMEADYTQKLSTAREEAGEVVKNATQRAQRESDALLAETQQKISGMMERADAEIAQQRKKAVNEMKNEISGIAMQIATQVVEREIRAEDHEALIEEFIKNVGDAS